MYKSKGMSGCLLSFTYKYLTSSALMVSLIKTRFVDLLLVDHSFSNDL